jgi:purine-nucleoside phosphorylase
MYAQATRFLSERLPDRPEIGVVLGSGLGGFADELEDAVSIPYTEIPGWPRSTAAGHAGKFAYGTLGGVRCAVLSGRAHLYEGYSAARVTLGVRVLKLLGIRALILTCAAGGINTAYSQGALVLISDHINLQGANALAGANEQDFGPRFPDMTEAYSKSLRDVAMGAAAREKIELHEGVYAAVLGPSYETPAEIRFLRTAGADCGYRAAKDRSRGGARDRPARPGKVRPVIDEYNSGGRTRWIGCLRLHSAPGIMRMLRFRILKLELPSRLWTVPSTPDATSRTQAMG